MDELKRGDVLAGRYRVEKVLGEGAMGAVHLCTDQQLFGARWAVKSVGLAGLGAAEAEEATALFLREADMLTRLRHPALPRVVDVFREGDRHFMVMELIIGETLDDRMTRQRAPFGENELLPILRQLASALQYLHSLSPPVIFRDLKPSNVMVTVDGKVQLIDFGIARRHKPGRKADTIILGTPGFCAPEQYGIAQTEPRSDLYALGAMAWHLLSGQDPALVGFTFPPLRQVAPGCTAVTEAILARCLAFNVEDRYPSAAILLADLEFAGSRDAIKRELELLRKPYVARAPVLSPRGYETRRLVGDAQPLAAAAVAQADTPSAPPFEPVRPITHRAGPALDEARFLRSWLARTFEVWWGPGSIHMPRIIALMLLMTVLLPF
ncbi:MAG: serine/threonine protein kinase, partial [Armatimonadetes bacterium]|nr:serine/threonine protein kinase [Armatimonadota bacterium]